MNNNIVLKPFLSNDIPKLISWISSPEFLIQWCGRTFNYPLTEEQLSIYLGGAEAKPPQRIIMKAVDEASGFHIGNITLERIDLENKSAAITCVIVGEKEYKGKGICEIMVREMIDTAFGKLGLDLLTLNVFDYNSPAIKCYSKCGFREVSRTVVNYEGKQWTNVNMILKKKS